MAAAYRSLPPTSARGPGLTKTQMQRSITDLQNFHGRSWVLTVPCTETLILGCIHLLVINSNRMTATRCGSSLSLSSPHQCPGPWPDENADAKKHHRPIYLSVHTSEYLSIYQSINLSIPRSISLALYPSIHPSIHPAWVSE